MTINERIKKIRTDKGYSQQRFADKINLSKNFINLLESGARNPSERTLKDIAVGFNVNLNWLKTGEGDVYEEESEEAVIKSLRTEYNLDDMDLEIIQTYIKMAPLERQVFKDFIKNIADKKKGEL